MLVLRNDLDFHNTPIFYKLKHCAMMDAKEEIPMKKQTLWCKNYTLLMLATTLGAIGGIAGSYAMSFLVFDETGSTLAAGFLVAIQILPHFLLPIVVAPWMDRMPRKPFLVGGDLVGGLLYGLAGIYLNHFEFSYIVYLAFSLVISSVNAFDSLAFNCIFPRTIPEGFEDKGYALSSTLYSVLNVLIMPVAALLMDHIGVGNILLIQCGLSILAAITENQIKIDEMYRNDEHNAGFSLWLQDVKDGLRYLKGERGLLNIYAYDAVNNATFLGYGTILVAFFRTFPGYSAQGYAFFSAAECIGRTIGGAVRYRSEMKPQHRRRFVYFVQQFYNFMDAILLWLPYPVMLVNRVFCGFLGINSATVRSASINRYIPEEYRARTNAVSGAIIYAAGSIGALLIGALGEVMDLRLSITVVSIVGSVICWLTVGRNKEDLDKIYLHQTEA